MTNIWKKRNNEEIKKTVFDALAKNINYLDADILGIPASHLDDKIFSQDATFLKDAPYISTLVQNPNHIGCHTLGQSEPFFSGTQSIETELIDICAVDILKGNKGQHDGYVASGGTEANIQAIWIYRNYFMANYGAKLDEISILCSKDSHYSMDKASNLLAIDILKIKVDSDTRTINKERLLQKITNQKKKGKKYYIVVANMMTTMFGSVDNVEMFEKVLEKLNLKYKIHVDGAFGGFYYPFSADQSDLTFKNGAITSFTLDAHKMAQAPYGTGLFIIRKGFIQYANTDAAKYVEGEDYTLIGSRSGANAIAVWMILSKNGPYGWKEKIFILQKRTEWLANQLNQLGVEFYRHPSSNIITMKAKYINESSVQRFGLVPDNHQMAKWYKIVIMDHVSIEKLTLFVQSLKA